jgi:hypothetical protein
MVRQVERFLKKLKKKWLERGKGMDQVRLTSKVKKAG